MKSWRKDDWLTLLMYLNTAVFGVLALVFLGSALYIASAGPRFLDAPWWLGPSIAGLFLEVLFALIAALAIRSDARRREQQSS
jgi:hypothetical protein